MKNRFLHTAIIAMLIFPMIMHAQGEIPNIENHSDDFIQASLLIGSPSEGVFSTMGRTSIRLRCEEYGMDNVYSYLMVVDDNESENDLVELDVKNDDKNIDERPLLES